MVLSHHLPLFLPKAACLPGSQSGARFWRDLGRRPVLLWTAHSAAKAAAPFVSPRRQGANAVPGGSWAPRAAARRWGGVRRGNTLSLATSNPTLGRASRLGAPRPGYGMRPGLPGVGAERALGATSRHPGPLAAWAQPRGRPHLEAGGRVGRIRGAGSRGRWNVRRGEEGRRLRSRSLLTPRKRPGESQSLPGARSGPRARRWQLCGSRARRAPVNAGLRLQPPSARGLLRHRPPGRRHGNDQL